MANSLAQALQSLTLVRQAIATGNLTADEEIEAREASAQIAEMLFNATHDPSRLSEATQHYQSIIRLLRTPSLRRAKFLDKLAYLEMTIFDVSKSMKVLDDSIAHSKQARDEALPTSDPLIRIIYQNLGYSVSHRAQLNNNSADLDEAIACGREVLKLSSPDSTNHQLTTNNLAARLHARYKMHHQSADAEEALSLLEEQLNRFSPGSPQHGSALMVRANILHDRYEQTNDIQHLDYAIAGFTAGLQSIGKTHEQAPDIHRNLSLLHYQRYKQKNDVADFATSLEHSKAKLALIPTTYQTRPDHVADYLTYLVEYTLVVESLLAVQNAIEETRTLREQVPKTHTKRHSCNLSMAGLLSKQYTLSHEINHLNELFSHGLSSVYSWNEKLDITQPQVPTDGLFRFSSSVRQIGLAPVDRPVRAQALEQLSQWHLAVDQSRTPFDSMVNMAYRHGQELDVFCRNLTSDERLSDNQISSGIESLQREKTANTAKDQGRQDKVRAFDRDDYIDPIFGHRQLAIDPVRKRIVVSMEAMVKSVLGYQEDEEEPKSWAEYEAREARLEHESFEQDKEQGKFPNPKLCRVCRHVKLLKPVDAGSAFAWNTQQYFPFGLYAQLLTRKHCAVCRLALSLDRADGEQYLHPHLEQIDREIQGTQFHSQKLPSGEIMLGIEYGMTTVGSLRIINRKNLFDAVRQSSQAHALRTFLEHPGQALPSTDQGDQRVDFQRIRGWLQDCHSNHGELCNGLGGSQRYISDIPLILVDVQDYCLVSATSAERYFTLSYVWGKVQIATTTMARLKERLTKLSLEPSELPNTIRDAMALVRSIGERYLWTDALCILQDDIAIRERDIKRMDIIYKKAFANLVALSGADANAGLPGVTANSRPPQQIEVLQISKGSSDLAFNEDAKTGTETIYLVATPQPLSLVQTSSMYNTRGWILQEQTLARRNVYFSSSYVYFQCGENTLCEVTLEGKYSDSKDDSKDDDDEGDKDDNKTALAIKNPISELTKICDLPEQDRLRWVFRAYSELVEIYTARNLTLATDIFDAFAGMLSAFKEEFRSETLYGLPIAALDLGLLWTSTETLAIRPERKSSTMTKTALATPSSTTSATDADAASEQYFPTWSWAGWIGGVDHRLLPLDKEPPPDSLIGEIYILRQGKILRLLQYQRACQDEDAKASPDLLAAYFGRMSVEARQAAPEHILHMFQPHVLNAGFSINAEREPDYLSSVKNVHLQTRQAVVRIFDKHGKHCGIMFEHIDYHGTLRLVSPSDELHKSLEALRTLSDKPILAISQTKDAYGDRTALSRVEGDIKRFDAYEFPARGPGSALVNVLVLSSGPGCFERIAVGQIHVKAWTEARPRRAWVKIG